MTTQIDNWTDRQEVWDIVNYFKLTKFGEINNAYDFVSSKLQQQITLAKAEERQRILKLIKKYSPTCGGGKCYVVEELINKIK